MGCCGGKSAGGDEEYARRLQQQYNNEGSYGTGSSGRGGRPFQGQGQRLGGGGSTNSPAATADERRAAAAAAAEARAGSWEQGGGTNRQKQKDLATRRQKDELVGKIQAHYAAKGEDPPFGLPAASIETLRKHYNDIK